MRIDWSGLGGAEDAERDLRWRSTDLAAAAAARRGVLARLGIGPGRRVLIAHGGSPEFLADLLAVWGLGGSAICLDPTLTAGEVANLQDFTGAAAVLVRGEAALAGLPVPVLDTAREPPGDDPGDLAGALDDEALILFTSGTTGDPKGVVHAFRGLLARAALNRQVIGPALRRSLCVLPTHFGHGLIGNCLTPLLAGGDVVFPGTPAMRVAAGLGALIADRDIGFMSSVPSFWRLALKLSRPPSAAVLRRVHVGSAPFPAALWGEIRDWTGTDDVVNCYGITETANWIGGASLRDHQPEDGLVGPVWGGAAMTVDAEGRPAPEGEIAVQTPSLMTGYLDRPDLTRQVLRGGWFFTGDTGRVAPDGTIRLSGRMKEEINRAGMKVQPAELDLLLERHPDVVEACAFGVPDAVSGEVVGIALRLQPGMVLDAAALRGWCLARIRRDAVPERWFQIDEIPRTDRGKVSRAAVRDACLRSAAP